MSGPKSTSGPTSEAGIHVSVSDHGVSWTQRRIQRIVTGPGNAGNGPPGTVSGGAVTASSRSWRTVRPWRRMPSVRLASEPSIR